MSKRTRQELAAAAAAIIEEYGMGRVGRTPKRRPKRGRFARNPILTAAPTESAARTHLYVIEGSDAVKVGIARDVLSRLAQLQTGSPRPLRVHMHVEVDAAAALTLERECHRRLTDARLSGEWFAVRPDEAAEIVRAVVGA